MPPPPDEGIVPAMEWWDEAFLPKELRETRKKTKASQDIDDYPRTAAEFCKTIR
jgi:hypothetical protein